MKYTFLIILNLFFYATPAWVQEIYAGRYNAILTSSPKMVPTAKTPDGALAGSSGLKKGKIEYVKLLSEKGRPCIIENPWKGKKVQVKRNGKKAEILEGETFNFSTKENEMIELSVL